MMSNIKHLSMCISPLNISFRKMFIQSICLFLVFLSFLWPPQTADRILDLRPGGKHHQILHWKMISTNGPPGKSPHFDFLTSVPTRTQWF